MEAKIRAASDADAAVLDVLLERDFLDVELQRSIVGGLQALPWYRVRYQSARFGQDCETPCWSNCFGGFRASAVYQPMPEWLLALKRKIESRLRTPFNVALVRLYPDNHDNIGTETKALFLVR